MNKILLIIILTLSFQSLIKADDIRDFQIEGISIGDSILDHFNQKKINKSIENTYKDETFISKTFSSKDSKLYEHIQLSYKKSDKKKIIHGVTGVIKFKDNLDNCLEEMKSIDKDLSEMFPNSMRTDWGKYKMATGNGFYYPITFDFKDKSSAQVSCQDFNDSSNIDNNLKVSVFSDEFDLYLQNQN
jgi:hypothetical protein